MQVYNFVMFQYIKEKNPFWPYIHQHEHNYFITLTEHLLKSPLDLGKCAEFELSSHTFYFFGLELSYQGQMLIQSNSFNNYTSNQYKSINKTDINIILRQCNWRQIQFIQYVQEWACYSSSLQQMSPQCHCSRRHSEKRQKSIIQCLYCRYIYIIFFLYNWIYQSYKMAKKSTQYSQ